jgi:hypothetical protein
VIVVAAWFPVLPPVPMSSGTKSARTVTSSSVASNTSSTWTVSVAPTARTSSHTMRVLASDRIDVAR